MNFPLILKRNGLRKTEKKCKHLTTKTRKKCKPKMNHPINLEDTNLQDLQRIRKLIAMVSISCAFCVSLGIYSHRKIKKIKIKSNINKTNSFFRTGVNMIFENYRKPELIE
jgi:sorbitol-specific phosphotransferase system component IIBC